MFSKDILIIDRPILPGEKFDYPGSIIFKTFVPDNVEVIARNGAIILEEGGGNNLKLDARAGGSVAVHGNRISDNFQKVVSKPQLSGITSKGRLGANVAISTDAYVDIGDAADKLKVRAAGSFKAGNLGKNALVEVMGSISVGNVGTGAVMNASGSLTASSLGSKGWYNAGISVNVRTIKSHTFLHAGGTINAGHAEHGADLSAGGSINLGSADAGVLTRAGGSVRIAGLRLSKRGPGPDFGFKFG